MLQLIRDKTSSPTVMTLGGQLSHLPLVAMDKEREEIIYPWSRPPCSRQEQGWLSCAHALRVSSSATPSILCCRGEIQHLYSQVLLQVKGRDSSLLLMTSGPALLPAIGGQGKGGGGHFFLTHVTTWQISGGASSPMCTSLGVAHLYSHYQGQFYFGAQVRCRTLSCS